MAYIVRLARKAEKELFSLDKPAVRRIAKVIDGLADNPRPPGCRKLTGFALWRIRVGDYRIIYAIDDEVRIVAVERIAHRKEAYE